jgi:cytochrome c peroxidase
VTGYDPGSPPTADTNSPFLRHDVHTDSVFDRTNPFEISNDTHGLLGFQLWQNAQTQVPGNRSALFKYLTPVLNDVWNTAPYLHDGSAPTLLDVVRQCVPAFQDCNQKGSGRTDGNHGVTRFLSARQLNDLVAFQEAPHGPINEIHTVSAVDLDLQRLQLRFGKKAGKDALTLVGRANLSAEQVFDPATEPVTISIGVPAGNRMAIVERTLPPGTLKANRSGTAWRFADKRGTVAAGLRQVVLTKKHGALALRAAGSGMDLAILKVTNPDLTIALEVGDDTMALTRRCKSNRKGTRVTAP